MLYPKTGVIYYHSCTVETFRLALRCYQPFSELGIIKATKIQEIFFYAESKAIVKKIFCIIVQVCSFDAFSGNKATLLDFKVY